MADDVLLEKIANHYLFYGSFHSDLGLYNGKMGMVIFFFHYARYTGNSLYEDFAEEFLNEILENLHTETPISFKRGLAGIGWGMLYLIKQGFMETDIQETFKDMDDKVMEYNLLYMKDRSLETGAIAKWMLSMVVIGHVVAVAIMKVAEVLLLIIMELLTIKSVLAAEIQLVDVLLMVVILYLEQLYNNEPCSKYAVR